MLEGCGACAICGVLRCERSRVNKWRECGTGASVAPASPPTAVAAAARSASSPLHHAEPYPPPPPSAADALRTGGTARSGLRVCVGLHQPLTLFYNAELGRVGSVRPRCPPEGPLACWSNASARASLQPRGGVNHAGSAIKPPLPPPCGLFFSARCPPYVIHAHLSAWQAGAEAFDA